MEMLFYKYGTRYGRIKDLRNYSKTVNYNDKQGIKGKVSAPSLTLNLELISVVYFSATYK